MNKKGIELSVNFLVMLIITLVVFSMGIYLLKIFFGTADEITNDINEQTKEQILTMLSPGERVAIPLNQETIARGDNAVFGLYILNVESDDPKFTVVTKHSGKVVGSDGNSVDTSGCALVETPLESEKVIIEKNDHIISSVFVIVPDGACSGKHIINVYVCKGDKIVNACDEASEAYTKSPEKVYVSVA